MKSKAILTAAALAVFALPVFAQEQVAEPAPSPNQIVDLAAAEEWVSISPEDILVMTLAPDAEGQPREVIIQLIPPPFSEGWVHNIKLLARSGWYDGISVNRVQDNYVVQWGDPGHDNPKSGEVETKPLPEGLKVMNEGEYVVAINSPEGEAIATSRSEQFNEALRKAASVLSPEIHTGFDAVNALSKEAIAKGFNVKDPYVQISTLYEGWPVGLKSSGTSPVHCYGMIGVGRSLSPDTGSGAELYTVIGHAPRHLDRNIALVGRIIEGMEHLSTLPRGSGVLGFYTEEEADKRTPILSIRVASDIPEFPQRTFEYLSTDSASFARYAEARANRRDPFFIHAAGGADICNIPVPIRRVSGE